jgi:hypothetical protein
MPKKTSDETILGNSHVCFRGAEVLRFKNFQATTRWELNGSFSVSSGVG